MEQCTAHSTILSVTVNHSVIIALFYFQNKSWLHLATSKFYKRLSHSLVLLSELIKPVALNHLNALSVLADVAGIIWCFRCSWCNCGSKDLGVLPERDAVCRSGWVCLEIFIKLPISFCLYLAWRYMKIILFKIFLWEGCFEVIIWFSIRIWCVNQN
jgi:hypothetical protein